MTLRAEIKKLIKASKEPKSTTRISFPQTVRLRILARCGFTCQHCGASLFEIEPHIDHIVPLAKGGTNDESNLQALCAPCNLAKGTQDDQGAKLMNRKEILDEANRLTHGDRDKNYGTPKVNHERIAALWSVVLETEIAPRKWPSAWLRSRLPASSSPRSISTASSTPRLIWPSQAKSPPKTLNPYLTKP